MDFYRIETRPYKNSLTKFEVYPEFKICRSKELMVRGGDFYVVFDKSTGMWTEDKVIIQEEIDDAINQKIQELSDKEKDKETPKKYIGRFMGNFSSNQWTKFDQYVRSLPDNSKVLDQVVTFQDPETDPDKKRKPKREDYISKELPYSLSPDGSYEAWDELISQLYEPEERLKIEWAIGSILSGDAKKIQKFLVFYGPQGSGKSTILNIVMKLLDGYYATFKAENLVNSGDQFGCKFLSSNPLVAIDEDTNLSRIETNATINKIASHEELEINEKYKSQYVIKPMCMMMLGTNKPVRITDAKSGIIRRLIDIEPSGRKIRPMKKYEELINQIGFELGAIAYHCMQVYEKYGRHLFDDYVPERMMYRTDPFFNFMVENQDAFLKNGGVEAADLWNMWKNYCKESEIQFTKKRFEIIDEAKNYFRDFKDRVKIDGNDKRSWFSDLDLEKLNPDKKHKNKDSELANKLKEIVQESVSKKDESDYSYGWLHLDQTESLLDKELAEYPAQYETNDPDHPLKYTWKNVRTKLKNLDTSKTHYVKGPGKLIFIDFDKHGTDGKKDLKLNIKAAGSSKWKKTYAELSNSECGIHLLYWYDGDVTELSSIFDAEIEIKVFPEDQFRSMRRKVTRCNNEPIAHISSGLPFKEKKVINWDGVKDEQHLRNMILKAVKKEIRPYDQDPKTITCVKYISDVLKNAQDNGMKYDIHDLDNLIEAFAASSHHNKDECLRIYYNMDLIWPKEIKEPTKTIFDGEYEKDAPIIILDCEVVKNLLLVVYKELGPEHKCVRLFNPTINQIKNLMEMKIVGHNVKGYDNFILWAAYLGYSPERIFEISRDIIVNGNRIPFREAIDMSYTDTLDVASEKKSLKKIEIEMHIPHKEMEIDWSKPLPESEWERLAQYCENDVLATEAYFLSKKWQADFKARKILAELTGMTVNDSTNNLVAQLIFGDVKEPWHEFIYPNLKEKFPEYHYEFVNGNKEKIISYYGTGDDQVLVGEGGRVYAEPGVYYNTITFDVASMHPTSIIVENGFGPYTQHYKDLFEARIAIKHKDYDTARKLFGGRLAPYLTTDEDADDLAYALKIALNSTYGMTAAKFQNRFKDPRNIDNWVAKRGALFMEKLRREVQARKGHVIHIKTDSIKLVDPSKELQDFVLKFGKDHGYTFEVENKFERVCLINDAVYVALRSKDDPDWLKECGKAQKKAEKENVKYIPPTRWTATGARYQHPYVFKRIFSHEPLDFWDFCETKTVKTTLYLDMNEKLKDVSAEEKEKKKIEMRIKKLVKEGFDVVKGSIDDEKIQAEINDLKKDISVLDEMIAEGHNYVFVGKAGEFVPVKSGYGGGLLMRKDTDDSYGYATGAKGYRWLESESLKNLDNWKEYIDIRYFRGLCDDALAEINKFGDAELFVQGEPKGYVLEEDQVPDNSDDPWMLPCGSDKYAYCSDCPEFSNDENKFGYCCKLGYNIENQILGESKEN